MLKFIPKFKRKPKSIKNLDLITLEKPGSFISEQFKLLRSRIMFPEESDEPPKSIMVTSSIPGEGTTFVAANMAISFASSIDTHVLLMDCDLRSPRIHQLFHVPDTPGLSEYLAGKCNIMDSLHRSEIEKLTLMPAGAIPENPSELLSSGKMKSLLNEFENRYDDRLVIIDSPPPKLTSEASVIGRLVDAIVLVVRYGMTPKNLVEEILEFLDREKIIGIVFNSFDMRSSIFSGYGKYGKYYSRYKIIKNKG